MDTQALFSHGGEMVKNPNYSPNNGQPEYINNTDISKNRNGLASTFYKATESGLNYSVTDEDLIRKSKKFGVPLNREDIESGVIDKKLYQTQSRWSKVFNSLEQAVVGEIGLGTLKGFSEIADMIGNAITDNDFFHESGLTKFIADLQEKNKQAFEINTDPNVHLGSGALTNLSWYAENFPSVMSSITLLIPARALTKGISSVPKLLSKGARALSKTEKGIDETSKLVGFTKKGGKAMRELNGEKYLGVGSASRDLNGQRLEVLSDAAFMRTMENYQEAKQVSSDMFNYAKEEFADDDKYREYINTNPDLVNDLIKQGININDKDEVARYIANKSAFKTFREDYVNTIFDIIQVAALRNPAKIGKNRKYFGRKVAQSQRRSVEKPAEALTATEAAEKQLNIAKKTVNWFKDTSGHLPSILAESTESIEEAVNYIAQQEGMTYGKILLGSGEEENIFKSNRLKEYWNSPEMWDAAFWGFVGGITFEAGASKLNLYRNAVAEKRKDKKNGAEIRPFKEYLDIAEEKYRVNDIAGRYVQFEDLVYKFGLINDGKNPFKENEDGSYDDFANDTEREDTIEQVKNQYIGTLTLSALQAGNYNMLKSYLQNDNVRKALVENGVIEEEGSNAFIDDMVSKMDKIATTYEDQLYNLDKLTRGIKEKVPVEYLQMVARKNTLALMDVESLELDQNVYQQEVDKLVKHIQNDPNIKDKDLIYQFANETKLQTLSYRLAEIQASLKTLKEDENVRTSIMGAIQVKNLERQRDTILNEIQSLENIDATAASVWALLQAENSVLDENGKLKINDLTKSYITYAQAIQNKDAKLIKELLETNGLKNLADNLDIDAFVTDSKQGTYNLLAQSLNQYSEFVKNNKYLHEQQQKLEYLKLLELQTKSNLIANRDDLLDEINYINDSLTNAIDEGQKQAENNILDIANKLENGEQAVFNYVFYNQPINNISDEDLATLDDSIALLNLRQRSEGYINRLQQKLQGQFTDKLIKQEQEKESSSTNPNPSESTKSVKLEDTTSEPQKSNVGQESGTDSSNNTQNGSISNGFFRVTVTADDNKKLDFNPVHSDVKEANVVELNQFEENQYELKVKDSKNDVTDLLQSTTLYQGYDSNQEKNPNLTRRIDTNPIITFEKKENGENVPKVLKKGLVSYISSIPFTGEEEQDSSGKGDEAAPYDAGLAESENGVKMSRFRTGFIKRNLQTWVDAGWSQKQINDEVNKQLTTEFKDIDEPTRNAVMAETSEIVASQLNIPDDPKLAKAVRDIVDYKTGHEINQSSQSTVEEKHTMPTDIIEAVNQILSYYTNKHELSQYKSKLTGKSVYFINLQQLLEDIDKIYNNKGIVQTIYKFVKDYLDTDEGKAKYIVTDLNVNGADFLDRLNQEAEKQSSDISIQKTNTTGLDADGFKELINLKADDKLDVTIEDFIDNYGVPRKRLALKHNGNKVGSLALANYNAGVYSLFNDGWRYEVYNDNGHIKSNVLDLFVELLGNEEIYNTLLLIRSSATNDEQKKQLKEELLKKLKNYIYKGQKLENNYIFESDGTEGTEKTNKYQEVDHLLDLLSYDLAKDTYESAKPKLKNSIYNFTKKLYESYRSAKHLQDRINENQKVTVNVNKVPIGIFKAPVETVVTRADYPRLKQSNSVLVDIPNIKIGIQERYGKGYSGKIIFSDGVLDGTIPGLYTGEILVSIPNKNDRYFNTRALSTRFNDNDIDFNSEAGKVIDFIRKEFGRRIDDWKNTDEHFDDFVNFIRSLIYRSNPNETRKNEPILTKIEFYDNRKEGANIQIKVADNIINIFKNKITTSIKQSNGEYKHITYTRDGKANINNLKKVFNNILDNAEFNISLVHLKDFTPANKSKHVTNGFIHKEGNYQLRLEIPSITGENYISELYDDYKDFILRGGFVKVNANKYTRTFKDDNKTTTVDIGNFDMGYKPNLTIEVPIVVDNNSPVKEEMTKIETPLSPIEKAINSKRDNAFNSAFKLAGLNKVTIGDKEFNVLNTLKRFGLYTNKITFKSDFNTRDSEYNYTGAIAKVDPKTGEITVGSRWIDMFNLRGRYANPKYRAEAVRKLIHETLHHKFHIDDNDVYVKKLQEVFDDFKKAVDKLEDKELKETLEEYFFKELEADKALEEFVVESFTNDTLAGYLNTVSAGNYKVGDVEKKDRTLFQKILDFLAKIFNWNIVDDSLYAKEFILLGKALNSKPLTESQNVEVQEETKEEEKPITEATIETAVNSFLEDSDEPMYSTREEKYNDIVYDSRNDLLNDAKPEDRELLIKKLNSGEISEQC